MPLQDPQLMPLMPLMPLMNAIDGCRRWVSLGMEAIPIF
jgi:hypothetical protein